MGLGHGVGGLLAALGTCNQGIPSPQRACRLQSALHFQSSFSPRLATVLDLLTKGSLVLTSKVDSLSISSPAPLLKLLRYETARVLIIKYHENPQSSLYSRRLEAMGARKNGCLRRLALSFSPITSKRLLRGLNLKGNWKFVIRVWFKEKNFPYKVLDLTINTHLGQNV